MSVKDPVSRLIPVFLLLWSNPDVASAEESPSPTSWWRADHHISVTFGGSWAGVGTGAERTLRLQGESIRDRISLRWQCAPSEFRPRGGIVIGSRSGASGGRSRGAGVSLCAGDLQPRILGGLLVGPHYSDPVTEITRDLDVRVSRAVRTTPASPGSGVAIHFRTHRVEGVVYRMTSPTAGGPGTAAVVAISPVRTLRIAVGAHGETRATDPRAVIAGAVETRGRMLSIETALERAKSPAVGAGAVLRGPRGAVSAALRRFAPGAAWRSPSTGRWRRIEGSPRMDFRARALLGPRRGPRLELQHDAHRIPPATRGVASAPSRSRDWKAAMFASRRAFEGRFSLAWSDDRSKSSRRSWTAALGVMHAGEHPTSVEARVVRAQSVSAERIERRGEGVLISLEHHRGAGPLRIDAAIAFFSPPGAGAILSVREIGAEGTRAPSVSRRGHALGVAITWPRDGERSTLRIAGSTIRLHGRPRALEVGLRWERRVRSRGTRAH